MKKEWFENWFDSAYYPILYNNRNWEEAGLFIDRLFEKLSLPENQKIVDIACGEGRFAAQMAQKGHDVIGIDLSPERIAVAQQWLEKDLKLKFQIHDMRMPYYNAYFDYAFNFFTSFGYFNSQRDTFAAARSMYKCLKPSGILLIDFFNAHQVIETLVPTEVIQKGDIIFNIEKEYDKGEIIKTIEVKDPKLEQSKFYEERVSAFFLKDFEEIFVEQLGMELIATYGDYDLNPYSEKDSSRLVMKFKK